MNQLLFTFIIVAFCLEGLLSAANDETLMFEIGDGDTVFARKLEVARSFLPVYKDSQIGSMHPEFIREKQSTKARGYFLREPHY